MHRLKKCTHLPPSRILTLPGSAQSWKVLKFHFSLKSPYISAQVVEKSVNFLQLWIPSELGKHISLRICVSQVGKQRTHITRGMCFPGKRTHISRDMCFPGGGTHITKDMSFPGGGTHITRESCFPGGGTHITRDTCFPGGGTHITVFPRWRNTYH